jgi:hypothetical protein
LVVVKGYQMVECLVGSLGGQMVECLVDVKVDLTVDVREFLKAE